jgi:lysophospholipase L1-like esterase
MKHEPILMLSSIIILLASCGKDPELPQETRFSILGDSYSTFEGYVQPDSNDVWYCPPPDNYINVTSVEQMWWYQVAQAMGWTLERNNSFSGSLVCNWNYGNYYGPYSFLRRMDNLGNPDVILVFGGTNDVWDGVSMGEFKYSDWTEEELCTFRPALACLFFRLQRLYPKAKVCFMADSALGDTFLESVHTIADYYGIHCIDLHDIEKDWDHPTAEGMTTIASQVVAALREMS